MSIEHGATLPSTLLKRRAIVYVRQSTQTQVMQNLESQRRQYDLVETARGYGFAEVDVIDDDLGVSASGCAERPGFERLAALLCSGSVGAVFCLEVSRLARNGRDWHHVLELCGLVEARVIDHDGVYDPRRPNDRLLLGMKGSISEFELGVMRTRMVEAARSKARRGELRYTPPIGYLWDRHTGVLLDPDLRIQEVIKQIFSRFRDLASARQVLLAMADEGVHFPRPSDGVRLTSFDWRPIRYRNVISVLKNMFYAGVYVYGKTSEQALDIIREMAGRWSDEAIAACLNRQGMPTGQGKTWNAKRVSSIRRVNDIHGYLSADKSGPYRTMTEAANELGVTNHVIRKLIKDGILSAKRLVEGAPYQIHADDLLSESVQDVIKRKGRPCRAVPQNQISMFPNT